MPDVFLPACLTPGTTGLMVVHNHPSGDPTPSPDDARLTMRLCAAADVLDIALLDHLIVGDDGRYFSFHEGGQLTKRSYGECPCPPLRPSHSGEALSRVKASLAPLAAGAALTRPRHFARRAFIEAAGDLEERRTPMLNGRSHPASR